MTGKTRAASWTLALGVLLVVASLVLWSLLAAGVIKAGKGATTVVCAPAHQMRAGLCVTEVRRV